MSASRDAIDRIYDILSDIALYYSEKFAYYRRVTIRVPGTGGEPPTTETEEINVAAERLAKAMNAFCSAIGPKRVKKTTINPTTNEESYEYEEFYITTKIESFLRTTFDELYLDTQNAFSTQIINDLSEIERGQVLKTIALGEIDDISFFNKTEVVFSNLLSSDYPTGVPGANPNDKAGCVTYIVDVINAQRDYILNGIGLCDDIINILNSLNSQHSIFNNNFAFLALFSSSGDIVTHTYTITPKSKNTIRSYLPLGNSIMDSIEASVPVIIANQLNELDIWSLVDSIDRAEVENDMYLTRAYDQLVQLRDEVSKQYLSNELPNIGNRVSGILININLALQDHKTNKTYDKFIAIQNRMQQSSINSLTSYNIINIAKDGSWKSGILSNYSNIINSLDAAVNRLKTY